MRERAAILPGLPGIDVSHYEGVIDWAAVKRAGIQFAYLKATEGINVVDPSFAINRAACKANDIPSGAYHFFRPKDSVSQQVDLFAKTFERLEVGELPPVLDVEVPSDWTALAVADRVAIIGQWLDAVNAKLNTTSILYLNPSMFKDTLGSSALLTSRPLWIAQYPRLPASQPTLPKGFKSWSFWQHSMNGSVGGIKSAVDLDRFNGTLEQLSALLVQG